MRRAVALCNHVDTVCIPLQSLNDSFGKNLPTGLLDLLPKKGSEAIIASTYSEAPIALNLVFRLLLDRKRRDADHAMIGGVESFDVTYCDCFLVVIELLFGEIFRECQIRACPVLQPLEKIE